jgi:exonuclease III
MTSSVSTLCCRLINARSLNNKLLDLHYLLDNEHVDILCVTESWLKPETTNSLLINDRPYGIFRKDRLYSQGGGVCIFTNEANVKAIGVSIPERFVELDIVCIDVVNTTEPLRIITCYRPPSSDTDTNAVDKMHLLSECLELLCDTVATLCLLGDFNLSVDWASPNFVSDNEKCSTIFTTFTSLFAFEQFVNNPTRLNNNSQSSDESAGSILDLVFCNDSFAIHNLEVHAPFSTSDHCSIDFNLLHHVQHYDHIFNVRNFNEGDWDSINAMLNDTDWNTIFSACSTVDECADAFYKVLTSCVENYVPLRESGNRSSNSRKYVPQHIKRLERNKLAIWKRRKRFGTVAIKAQYRAISRRCREAKTQFARKFEESIIESNNLGKFFRHANYLEKPMLVHCSALMAPLLLTQMSKHVF